MVLHLLITGYTHLSIHVFNGAALVDNRSPHSRTNSRAEGHVLHLLIDVSHLLPTHVLMVLDILIAGSHPSISP